MRFTTALIQQPSSWDALTGAVVALTRNRAVDIRYVAGVEELNGLSGVVHIVVMELSGAAQYAIEIHWAGLCDLADDAIAMHLACSIDSEVIISDDDLSPRSWLLLRPDGTLHEIEMDLKQLDEHNRVVYKVKPS